jgi:hypothetical protein
MDEGCRQRGLEILRLRKELGHDERKHQAGIARPGLPGSEARSVLPSTAGPDAESIRMRFLTAEMQYKDLGCTEEYLGHLADELAAEEVSRDGDP